MRLVTLDMQPDPTITLLLAPTAAGKTRAALEALRAPRRGRALLLVANSLQRRHLRTQATGIRRRSIHQFYGLADRILRQADSPPQPITGPLATMLLRQVIADLSAAGRLPIFAHVALKPGFIANLADLIAEAQQALLTPSALIEANVTPYDAELGTLYAAYLAAMERLNLADTSRRLALACAAIQAYPALLGPLDLFVVDGFDQFTPLQIRLLVEISRRAVRTIITLTGSHDDRPAHRRFNRTRQQLIDALHPTIPTIAYLPHQSPINHQAPLAFFEQHLFDLDRPDPVAADGTLLFIRAADREREVRAALRHVHMLLHAATPPEQIALLLRNPAPYAPLLREVAHEYGLPLAIFTGLPLHESPTIVAYLTMLRLPTDNYPRRDLVETWRAFADGRLMLPPEWPPASIAPDLAAALFDRAGRDAGIVAGLQPLQATLTKLAAAEPPPADIDQRIPTITAEQASELLMLLNAFAAWLTPPPQASIGAYVAWAREHTLPSSASLPETTAAWSPIHQQWSSLLDELAQAATLLDTPPVAYNTFLSDLHALTSAATYGMQQPQAGQVAVLPNLAARGLFFDHVLLLGMAEGEFPARMPEPSFYSRRERAQLAHRGINLPAPDPADERSLFYETIARAQQSITLTRTYLDESGNMLPPSPYIAALATLVQSASAPESHIRAGSLPTSEQAVSPQEHLVAFMIEQYQQKNASRALSARASVSPALLPLLPHVERTRAAELAREQIGPYGPFEGMLHDSELCARLAAYFGPQHRWSITQLNDYITCPFRFAAAHLLHLEQRNEPEEGLDRSRRGQLYHAILSEAGKLWRQQQLAHTDDQQAAILGALHTAADQVLAAAPERYGIAANAFWDWDRADIRRRLERALRRVLRDGADWADFRPAMVEQSFGMQRGAEPLKLTTPAGDVLVSGRIDRLDQRADGALALIDYKSSNTPRSITLTTSGRDVQLAIYLLAAEQLLAPGKRVERAAFLHLGSGKHSPPLTDKNRQEAIDAMTVRVSEAVSGARSGHFPVRPRDDCPTACSFKDICRLNLAKRQD